MLPSRCKRNGIQETSSRSHFPGPSREEQGVTLSACMAVALHCCMEHVEKGRVAEDCAGTTGFHMKQHSSQEETTGLATPGLKDPAAPILQAPISKALQARHFAGPAGGARRGRCRARSVPSPACLCRPGDRRRLAAWRPPGRKVAQCRVMETGSDDVLRRCSRSATPATDAPADDSRSEDMGWVLTPR